MRSRSQLHKTKLSQFANWLKDNGWKEEFILGNYEVARFRNPKFPAPIIIYSLSLIHI